MTKGVNRVEVDATRRAGGGVEGDGTDLPRVSARAAPGVAGEEAATTRSKSGLG